MKDSNASFLKTDGGKTKSNAIEVPSISLPKGGGAIKSIDEKFSVNAVNGTSSFSIPLPFSPARGASPSLSLSYNSGSGNGIFGLGWNLSSGSIKRKTDQGLPQYLDAIDSDTFLFSESEDLVPEFTKKPDGSFQLNADDEYVIYERVSADGLFIVRNYKPRIEGLFARIERWTEKATGIIKWRVITKENITTLFGWTPNSIIANPEDPTKIYEWLPEFVFDDKGNCSQYIYKKEDATDFDDSYLHNRNRLKSGSITYTNRYIDKVLYGNKTPYKQFGDAFPPETDYLFQTVFDYGTTANNEPFDKINLWDFRPDAFSNYKAGFEIRTTRLCKRVLLFHVFEELALKPDKSDKKTLIKSLNFTYDTAVEQDFTFLTKITSFGYIKKPDGSYSYKHLPPTEFNYQKHEWNAEIKTLSPDSLVHSPVGLEGQGYQFTDLYNEGLSGILTEQENGWYYKHNLGGGEFEQAKLVSQKPSFTGLGNLLQLADLDADGGKQLVSFSKEPRGFFELNDDNEWSGLHSFKALPNIDFGDPNTRMLDLNGDGKPELVISEDTVFTWYASSGREGYEAAQKTPKSFDEETGPHIVFADGKQTIFLADMSGDGLTDILRIRNGEVCYWPNLGYGKFGAKVAFDNAPVFDHPDAFNPSYLHLTDIDGSGTSDIIYLGKNKFTCWKNLSGNRFGSSPFEIDSFPETHTQSKIAVTDLLGNGVSCIVWSSSLSKDRDIPLKYIDLMNSKKPHILVSFKNNLGKEVSLEYTPSTKFYIEDKLAGKPWATKLHFPVHCISKTTVEDKISGHKFTSEYSYHHGYYDHVEREFRGFGMVQQTDSETFEHWVKSGAVNITDKTLHQEPIVTKTWNHTGAFLRNESILNQFASGYWHAEIQRQGFPITHHEVALTDAKLITAPGIDSTLLDHLSVQERQEAYRACKGMGLRSETFAKDAVKFGNTAAARKKELIPYSVAIHNCVIELLQPKGKNKHAVFIVKESESITYNYERNEADPRIAHNLNIKLDAYGNVLESASVVYPRLNADPALPPETQAAQDKTTITYSQNHFTNDVIGNDVYRLRLPSETKTYELKGVSKSSVFYALSDFTEILSDANSDTALYHELNKPLNGSTAQKRLIEHVRSTYYSNQLTGALPLHQLESLAIPYESYQLAYTPELITDIFGGKVTDAVLSEGKFTHSEGDANWWIRSGTTQFKTPVENETHAQNRFYYPISYTDPCGAITKVKYYGSYFLFVEETTDVFDNKLVVELFNFRTLSPKRMKDLNGNFSEAISDELGLIKATALLGKGNQADELTGISEITDPAESAAVLSFFQATNSVDLTSIGKSLLHQATARFVYDFETYMTDGKPAVVAAISRETHYRKTDGSLNPESKVQLAFEYSGGLGEIAMKKVQAEPGLAKQAVVNPDSTVTITEIDSAAIVPKQLRWIGNGKTIKNNKGNAVKQYEPYFSTTWKYENYKELTETGVTPIMHYDAASRLIKTELPNGTFSKVIFDSWKQEVYDANDTVLESEWYASRTAPGADAKENKAALKTAKHANTPNTLHFDTLGRPVLSVDHIRNIQTEADEFHFTQVELDVEGNLRTVTDARDNTVMQYKYGMLGNLVYHQSMDAGKRWLLSNILGNPLRTWDERDHEFQYFYDLLHRPLHSIVINTIGKPGDSLLNNIFDRIVYGESLLLPNRSNEAVLQASNLLGKTILHYDTAGLIDTPDYDFKGQILSNTRKLLQNYKDVADWTDVNLTNLNSLLEPGVGYITTTQTDALGRITQQTTPDGSVRTPVYNEAGLLDSESVLHPGAVVTSTYIKNIDYNEKGQREKISYGNDVSTRFYYDKETFRLKRLESKRLNNEILQDLYYTFDAVGNITTIEDKAIPISFFANAIIEAVSEYTYDALYRLVEATGRENNAALNFGPCDNWNDKPFMHAISSGDALAVRNYTQRYQYDKVGNIREMKHLAVGGNWTRSYDYETLNNHLKSTVIGDNGNPANYTKYKHHATHGFLEELPHLEQISWNFKEEVVLTSRQQCTDDNIPVTTYYQYDGNGQRIRKITENQATNGQPPTKKEERIYVAGYEWYKKHSGTHAGLERISLSLMDEGHRFVMVETRNNVDDGTEKQLVRYQLHNHLGSAALELDGSPNAKLISYEEYHPFGTTAYQARNAAIKSAAKHYRYTGMERDEETGLEYHSARYYLPWLGRWLSSDPIGIGDGVNVYAYVANNPINTKDPTGQWGWRDVAVIAAVVVVGTVVAVATAGAATPLIVGAVGAAGLTGTAATVATGVVVGAAAGAAGGFVGGAAGEATRQTVNHRALGLGTESYDGGRIFSEGGRGAATGAIIGGAVGGVAALATTAVGAAAIGAVGRGIQRAAPTLSRGAVAAARGLATGARAVARAPIARNIVGAAGRGLQAVENGGLSFARGSFSRLSSLTRGTSMSGSIERGSAAIERMSVLNNVAETFGAAPTRGVSPINGRVNVGGTIEDTPTGWTNLNPMTPHTGGANNGIPNLVAGGGEEMGRIFQPGSVREMISSKLPHSVDVERFAASSYGSIAKGGTFELNFFPGGTEFNRSVANTFQRMGFRNVTIQHEVMITGVK